MTLPASQIPDPAERAELNAALHATGADTGFWDEQGPPGTLARRHRQMEARNRPADHR